MVWVPFRDGVIGANLVADVTTGEVAETKESYRWQNTGTLRPPMPLGGGSSDVSTFETWLNSTPVGCTVEFPPGVTYLQSSMVRYLPARRYVWPGTTTPSTKWQVISGTNMGSPSGMWVPKVWDDNNDDGQNPVSFVHPCLDGLKTSTSGSHHGLIMGGSHWWEIERPEIFNCRGDGIRLTNLAKNGTTVLGSDLGSPNDMADGNISDVRIFDNLGCGIRQVLSPSVNAHMDVQLRGGRIFGSGESAVLGDRLAGWDISYLHIFTSQHYGIRSIDGWFDLGIHHNQIEDFGLAGGATFYAGISVKGYDNQGCDISHNRVRQTPEAGPEPGSGAMAYINVEGAGSPESMVTVAHNLVKGVASPRAGVVGISYNCSFGTLWVSGLKTNLVRGVAVPYFTTGPVHDPENLFVRKTADETVTSSTTLQNDDHLVLPVQPSAVYEVDLFVIYEASTAGDLKLAFAGPSGATLDWVPGGLGTAAAAATSSVKLQWVDIATAEGVGGIGTGAANRLVARVSGLLIVSSTAGNLQFQWAQNTSDATGTVVKAGSWLRLRRVF